MNDTYRWNKVLTVQYSVLYFRKRGNYWNTAKFYWTFWTFLFQNPDKADMVGGGKKKRSYSLF